MRAKNIETYPYVVNKNTTHLKSVAMRPVYLLPSSSPQRNTRASSKFLHFSRVYFGGNERNENIHDLTGSDVLEDSMTMMFWFQKKYKRNTSST
jgi:hypothetical protein